MTKGQVLIAVVLACDCKGQHVTVRWNGRMIRVTGSIRRETRSFEGGDWLEADGCSTKIQVKGISFRNTANIGYPQNKLLRTHDVTFDWDERSRRKLEGLEYGMDRETEQIHATVIGLFESRDPLESLVLINRAHPEGLPVGFGNQGVHPAQILVRTMTNLRLERKPDAAKN